MLSIGDKVRLNVDPISAQIVQLPIPDGEYVVNCVMICADSRCDCKIAVDEKGEIVPSHVLIAVQGIPDFFDANWFKKA